MQAETRDSNSFGMGARSGTNRDREDESQRKDCEGRNKGGKSLPFLGGGDSSPAFERRSSEGGDCQCFCHARFCDSEDDGEEARPCDCDCLEGQHGNGDCENGEIETGFRKRRVTSNDDPKPNIIVNYLPQTLTDKEFFHLFAPYGEMESIKIMRDSQTGYSFGYGFVNYVNLQDAIDARNALNGTQLGHKRIKVSFARPPSDDIKDTNLFVTGLPSTITEEELDKMFSPFGVIVHLRVLRDKQTRVTRGVAFVRYETRSEACSAILEMNGLVPEGAAEPIRVRLAQDHGKQKAAYLAGYQAALKMTVKDTPPMPMPMPMSARTPGPDISFRHSETSFDPLPRHPALPPRTRPRTATASIGGEGGIRVTTSSSDPSLFWDEFGHGIRDLRHRRPTTSRDRNGNGNLRSSSTRLF